jgi:hypothetical protein
MINLSIVQLTSNIMGTVILYLQGLAMWISVYSIYDRVSHESVLTIVVMYRELVLK